MADQKKTLPQNIMVKADKHVRSNNVKGISKCNAQVTPVYK